MEYPRPQNNDFENARAGEDLVGSWLGKFLIGNLDSETEMDFRIPGVHLDVKEKRQPLTSKWVDHAPGKYSDLFVLDELSVRKAMVHAPLAYFVLHDLPGERWFLARVDEIVCGDHRRLDRVGPTGWRKGKWIIDLNDYRRLSNPTDCLTFVLDDVKSEPWLRSECLIKTGEMS